MHCPECGGNNVWDNGEPYWRRLVYRCTRCGHEWRCPPTDDALAAMEEDAWEARQELDRYYRRLGDRE